MKWQKLVAGIGGLLLLAGMGSSAAAEGLWQDNGRVISAAGNTQGSACAVPDGVGGMIVAWQDNRSGSDDIYAQRLDARGNTLWAENGVLVSTAATTKWYPVIATDGAQGAIISWLDYTNRDVYAQRLDANGNRFWSDIGAAICIQPGNQDIGAIVSDNAGGAILIWPDERISSIASDIYAQRVDAAGNTLWAQDGIPVCNAAYDQDYPLAIANGAGGAVVAWQDGRLSSQDTYCQWINQDGSMRWIPNGVLVIQAAAPNCLSLDNSGGIFVAWENYVGSQWDLYAQHLDSSGARLWDVNGLAICNLASDQQMPKMVSDGSTGAILAWEDWRPGGYNTDIYTQHLSSNGSMDWGTNGKAICTLVGYQTYPQIISDHSGGAIIAWQDGGGQATKHCYTQRVSSSGNTLWANNGVLICTATDIAYYNLDYKMIEDGQGGAFIGWRDFRTTDADIYGQRMLRLRPVLTQCSPGIGSQGSVNHFTITGKNLLDDKGQAAFATLQKTGENNLYSTNLVAVDTDHFTCDFDLTTAATGNWNFWVCDTAGQTCTASLVLPIAMPTPTCTPTRTATATRTPTATCTPSASPTVTPSAPWTMTGTATPTSTLTPSSTPSLTVTQSPTASPSYTQTATGTISPTRTISPTISTTPTSTRTPWATPSPTPTPSPSVTATRTVELTCTATITRTLGLDLAGREVLIWPNPAHDEVKFSWARENLAGVKITIFNLTGERVADVSSERPAETIAWNCSGTASGIYFCRIILEYSNGQKQTILKKMAIAK